MKGGLGNPSSISIAQITSSGGPWPSRLTGQTGSTGPLYGRNGGRRTRQGSGTTPAVPRTAGPIPSFRVRICPGNSISLMVSRETELPQRRAAPGQRRAERPGSVDPILLCQRVSIALCCHTKLRSAPRRPRRRVTTSRRGPLFSCTWVGFRSIRKLWGFGKHKQKGRSSGTLPENRLLLIFRPERNDTFDTVGESNPVMPPVPGTILEKTFLVGGVT